MNKKLLLWVIPVALLLLSWSDGKLDHNPNVVDEFTVANELVLLVNNHRASIGKSLLKRSETADKLAAQHAEYMVANKGVNHDNYDLRWEILEKKENAEEVTENIGFDVSAKKALSACLQSAWLKANVEGDFTHTGIAVKKDSEGRYYYTQIFYK